MTGTVAAASLVWTPDGPSTAAAMPPGGTVLAVDFAAFTRYPASVRPAAQGEEPTLRLLVGGRFALLHPSQPVPTFDTEGTMTLRPAASLCPGDRLLVDRRVPEPAERVALPDGESPLARDLAPNGLHLLDALFERDKYFAEMGKRVGRLQGFEMAGVLLAAAAWIDGELFLPALPAPYTERLAVLFPGSSPSGGALPDAGAAQWGRWLGPGLHPAPERALPHWVWQLENAARAGLARGFFDATSTVNQEAVTLRHPSAVLLVGLQALLGTLGVEGELGLTAEGVTLHIRNVRRFAEWVGSNRADKEGILNHVYRREPRYPENESATLPLRLVRPALDRLRVGQPPRAARAERPPADEAGRLPTLRLLASAFRDPDLQALLAQRLYLEPITVTEPGPTLPLVALHFSEPTCFVANGIVLSG